MLQFVSIHVTKEVCKSEMQVYRPLIFSNICIHASVIAKMPMNSIITNRFCLLLLLFVTLVSTSDKSFAVEKYQAIDAEPALNKTKRWGLIIGINAYDDPNINWLRYAAPDARAIYEVLTHPQTGGFKREHLHLLTSGSENEPTRNNILESLALLSQIIQSGDTVLFYFSGHGLTHNGTNYLLPADTRANIPTETAIPLSKVYQSIQKATQQIIFLDACHSGWHRDKGAPLGVMSDSFAKVVSSEVAGRVTLTSCNINESSFEDDSLGSSVFTYYLLKALRGEADTTTDSYVTISEANSYVGTKVKAWAFANRRQQNPRISSNISREIVLTLASPTAGRDLTPAPTVDFTPTRPRPQPPRKPIIMVLIPEYHRRSNVRHPSGETEIIRLLVEQGFPVVDQQQIQEIRYKDEAKRAAQGDVAAAVALGTQFEAEIIIVGEASSQRSAGRIPGNIVACSAQLVVKAIQTDTGKILATHRMSDKGLDLTEELAAQKAFVKVGGKMADYLIGEMEHKWHQMATSRERELTLKIMNVTFKELLLFENALQKHIPSAQNLYRRHFDVTGKIAELEVTITGDSHQFVKELALITFDDFGVEVLNQTAQVLDIQINQKLPLTLKIANVTFKELLLFEDALQQHISSVENVHRQHFDVQGKVAEIKVTTTGDSNRFVKALALIPFDDFAVEVLNQTTQVLDIQINQKLSLTLTVVNVTFKELLLFENALQKRIPSVKDVRREGFNATENRAEITVTITGDSHRFVKALALIAFDDFAVEVLNQTPQALDIQINQKLPITLNVMNVTFKELLLFEDAVQKQISAVKSVNRQHFDVEGKIAEIKITITGDSNQFVKALALIAFDEFEVEVLNQTPQALDIQINQK